MMKYLLWGLVVLLLSAAGLIDHPAWILFFIAGILLFAHQFSAWFRKDLDERWEEYRQDKKKWEAHRRNKKT